MFLYHCFAAGNAAAAAAAASPQQHVTHHIATQQPDLAHKAVGPWIVTTRLGDGKCGDVRIATHSQTKQVAAVKMIDKKKLKTLRDVEHIHFEIKCMKTLKHPFIIQRIEVLTTANNMYLFMERINGTDLIHKIQQVGRLEENIARRYFQQLVVAVRYCHSKKIVHRDIKPDNILIDETSNSIKLIDFGLAASTETSELMTEFSGSPHYIAPDVLKMSPFETAAATATAASSEPSTPKAGYDGYAVDCWSLGITLFVILSGRYPFDSPSPGALDTKEMFRLIMAQQYTMSRTITPKAAALITNLLQVDPKKRYTIEQIIKDEWFQTDFDQQMLHFGDGITVETLKAAAAIASAAVTSALAEHASTASTAAAASQSYI